MTHSGLSWYFVSIYTYIRTYIYYVHSLKIGLKIKNNMKMWLKKKGIWLQNLVETIFEIEGLVNFRWEKLYEKTVEIWPVFSWTSTFILFLSRSFSQNCPTFFQKNENMHFWYTLIVSLFIWVYLFKNSQRNWLFLVA